MTLGNQESTIYPDYCHELSPTIGRWCPIRAVDVHALQSVGMFDSGKEVYHHGNHPIKWVRLTGVIVAMDEFSGRRVLTLDDSSGMCIECTCPAPPSNPAVPTRRHTYKPSVGKQTEPEKTGQQPTPSVQAPWVPWPDINVGAVVKVKGKPGTFRDTKQVDIIKIEVLRATDLEVRCWNEVLTFRREVLRVPWVVTREAEERCRKSAEREKQYKSSSKRHEKKKAHKSKGAGEERRGKEHESDDKRRKRHDEKKRKHDAEEEGLKPENKANYPSLAMRRRLAGKYDALGI